MPNPLHGGKRAPNRRRDPRSAASIAFILAALPATKQEIMAATEIDRGTVYKHVKALRAAKLVRVAKWLPHPLHGPSIAVLGRGNKPDAVDNLPRLTSKQLSDRYLARIKGTDVEDQRRAKQRSRHWIEKARATPNTWLTVLGAH